MYRIGLDFDVLLSEKFVDWDILLMCLYEVFYINCLKYDLLFMFFYVVLNNSFIKCGLLLMFMNVVINVFINLKLE